MIVSPRGRGRAKGHDIVARSHFCGEGAKATLLLVLRTYWYYIQRRRRGKTFSLAENPPDVLLPPLPDEATFRDVNARASPQTIRSRSSPHHCLCTTYTAVVVAPAPPPLGGESDAVPISRSSSRSRELAPPLPLHTVQHCCIGTSIGNKCCIVVVLE